MKEIMSGLTVDQKRECISVLSTDMLISAFEHSDKSVEDNILLRDELIKRLRMSDPTTKCSTNFITAERVNNNGNKSIRITIQDYDFETLYVGELKLEGFAEFVQGVETCIRRKE